MEQPCEGSAEPYIHVRHISFGKEEQDDMEPSSVITNKKSALMYGYSLEIRRRGFGDPALVAP